MKKHKVKYDNILFISFLVIFVILIIIIGVLAKGILKDLKGSSSTEIEILEQLDDYNYVLAGNNTEYFKKLYYQLKDLLENDKEENFEEEYAKLVSQLFIADFYDLNSKLDKTNVGGSQFVWSDYQESFKNFATDSTGVYYYVENNVNGDRTQELPTVSEVIVTSIEQVPYENDIVTDLEAYQVELSISYEKDLGYPKKCTLILLHNDNKLEIAEME